MDLDQQRTGLLRHAEEHLPPLLAVRRHRQQPVQHLLLLPEPRRRLLVRRHRRHHLVPAPRPRGQPLCARAADHGRRCGRFGRRPPRAHRTRFGRARRRGGVPLGAQHLHRALRGGQSAGRRPQHLRLQAGGIQHPLVRNVASRSQLLEPQARALPLQGPRGEQRRTLERRARDGRDPRAADVVADPCGEDSVGAARAGIRRGRRGGAAGTYQDEDAAARGAAGKGVHRPAQSGEDTLLHQPFARTAHAADADTLALAGDPRARHGRQIRRLAPELHLPQQPQTAAHHQPAAGLPQGRAGDVQDEGRRAGCRCHRRRGLLDVRGGGPEPRHGLYPQL